MTHVVRLLLYPGYSGHFSHFAGRSVFKWRVPKYWFFCQTSCSRSFRFFLVVSFVSLGSFEPFLQVSFPCFKHRCGLQLWIRLRLDSYGLPVSHLRCPVVVWLRRSRVPTCPFAARGHLLCFASSFLHLLYRGTSGGATVLSPVCRDAWAQTQALLFRNVHPLRRWFLFQFGRGRAAKHLEPSLGGAGSSRRRRRVAVCRSLTGTWVRWPSPATSRVACCAKKCTACNRCRSCTGHNVTHRCSCAGTALRVAWSRSLPSPFG